MKQTTGTLSVHGLKVGDELPPFEKKAYQRLLDEAKFITDSMHTDDYSKKLGYPGALMSSYVFTGYVSEMMIGFFGSSWFDSGDFEMSFIGKGVQQGDLLSVRSIVTGIEPTDAGTRISLDIRFEKKDGVTPIVGRASCVHVER